MARDTIIAGNWKMNQNPQEVESFFKEIKPFLQNINKTKKKIEVIIFSPDIYLKNLLEKQELDVIKQVE
jgi:triosephosphate isomerase